MKHAGPRSLRPILFLCAALGGCAPRAPLTAPASPSAKATAVAAAPAGFPADWYRAAARGETVLRVDPARSLVEIEVRRGGPLARFGHDHLVAVRQLQGWVAERSGRADLYVELERLSVDEPGLRQAAGLLTEPAADAIEATRRNMLDKVLETGRYPYALISVSRIDAAQLQVSLTLHGVTRSWQIPAQLETDSNGMTVRGTLAFRQSEFGITPFSVLGGAMLVEDELSLRFRVSAAP